jgi:putative transposase
VTGDKEIQVPRIGRLKTFERLPVGYKPKSVTISRHADRWFISFRIEVEPTPHEKPNRAVGVDLGVKSLAVLSNGEVFEGAKAYRKYKAKLARMQYLARNKQRGSGRWKAAMMRIARLHQKIGNIRNDSLHKLTTYLARNFGIIGIEDLNVSGMMANHKLAGAVADMGFYEFRRELTYKCELYGSKLGVIGRWEPTSKVHHKCGWKNPELSLKDRTFFCPECNESIDRDLNAALNILRLCLEMLGEKDVERVAPSPRVEASKNQVSYQQLSLLGSDC